MKDRSMAKGTKKPMPFGKGGKGGKGSKGC